MKVLSILILPVFVCLVSETPVSLLWIEYCEECRKTGDIPYQSTQFNKYYGEYVRKTGATMHIERKPGESMEVDWALSVSTDKAQSTSIVSPGFLWMCMVALF
jgi:hypothetical protein